MTVDSLRKKQLVLVLQCTCGKPLFFALALTLAGSACNMRPYSSQCSLSSAHAYPATKQCDLQLQFIMPGIQKLIQR